MVHMQLPTEFPKREILGILCANVIEETLGKTGSRFSKDCAGADCSVNKQKCFSCVVLFFLYSQLKRKKGSRTCWIVVVAHRHQIVCSCFCKAPGDKCEVLWILRRMWA